MQPPPSVCSTALLSCIIPKSSRREIRFCFGLAFRPIEPSSCILGVFCLCPFCRLHKTHQFTKTMQMFWKRCFIRGGSSPSPCLQIGPYLTHDNFGRHFRLSPHVCAFTSGVPVQVWKCDLPAAKLLFGSDSSPRGVTQRPRA